MKKLREIIERFPRIKEVFLVIAGCVLCFAILLAAIFCGWLQMIKETSANADTSEVSEDVPNFGTEIQIEDTEKDVPNFGTTVSVINLDEAALLLEGHAVQLEVELSEYVSRNNRDETESNIIHVMIPEENEKQLFFFCKFSSGGEIVQVVFDREKDVFITLKSYYTEEEILSEIWNGVCPSDRDIQE